MSAPTPMMAQYLRLKSEAGDALLFYRMGDFFELFFEDATDAASLLQITLTRRGQHMGADIPMCGVPVHAAEGYLARLVRAGRRVAIAEQTEDPAIARRENRPVARAIVRIVTAATLVEDDLLNPQEPNWLAAVAPGGDGLAWADMSTGRFGAIAIAAGGLEAELARLQPAELLAPEGWAGTPARLCPPAGFRPQAARERLCERFGVATLDAFGAFGDAEIAAMGGLLAYLEHTMREARPRLEPPRRGEAGTTMVIDPASRASLQLGRDGLLGVIDRTLTAGGARRLQADLAAPLRDAALIGGRHDELQDFMDDPALRARIRAAFKGCPDAERSLARVGLGRGGPRDIARIGAMLRCAGDVGALLVAARRPAPARLAAGIADLADLNALIAAAIDANGEESIASGFDTELDRLRAAGSDGRRLIAELETRYRVKTGLNVLKVRHNAVLGYHLEAPARADGELRAAGFVHRQTLAGSVRFGTEELAALAERVAGAADAAAARERELLEDLRGRVLAQADEIARTADALARIDVAAALAELAACERWVRPELTEGAEFTIEGGRHPLVEAALGRAPFVANDCDLAAERLLLVTGPNMGGKSTFLRQNALIAILAQAGSFVPARRARIGVVDRLFSRVGASDDLASGRSTFMVEMVETAAILRQATRQSFVILDEVGRGTSTYDGLAIAWAVLEWLHDRIGCRCLFATHYHELTRLADRLEGARNIHVRAREWRGQLVFLHEVAAGAADRSYGLAVAKLAGTPDPVLARAKAVLDRLEAGRAAIDVSGELPLFAAAGPAPAPARADPLRERLRGVELDALSPREAFALVEELKAIEAMEG